MGSVIFKRPPLKKLAKEGLFGVDMHFHTRYSMDGISRVTSILKKARKKGIGLAVTDHNEVKGAISAFKNSSGVIVIPGIEISCKNGVHLLSYFRRPSELEEFFSKRLKPRMQNPFFVNLSAAEVLKIANDYNCLTCAPHPFSPGALGIRKLAMTKSMEKDLDLIEVINGYCFRKHNLKAIYWAASLNKGMTGGSDGHMTLELGKVLTCTHADDINGIFKEVMKNRAVVIGKERNMFLKAAMAVRKEGAYINRSKRQNMAKTLLKSQFGSEYSYFKQKFNESKVKRLLTGKMLK